MKELHYIWRIVNDLAGRFIFPATLLSVANVFGKGGSIDLAT